LGLVNSGVWCTLCRTRELERSHKLVLYPRHVGWRILVYFIAPSFLLKAPMNGQVAISSVLALIREHVHGLGTRV